MITITILKNPFDYSDKEVHTLEYIPGKMAYEYIQPYIMGLEDYIVSSNGNVVEDAKAQLVSSDDWLAVCPVVGKSGRDWFRTIFSIALTSWISSTTVFSKAFDVTKFWSGMAAGAITAVGGTLINHWFPAAKADQVETKSSYNWGNAQSQTGQGNALAVTYGTMRTAGQVLAQHVLSDDEDQYLNILLCGGEGPIDSISDIRINDNPISYYKNVTVETQLGTNDQQVIGNFNDTYDDQALAYELSTDNTWATQQTEGNAVEGLEITLQFPGGLYYANDDGSLGNASITVNVQYRKVGDTNWKNFTDATITAAQNTAFFRTFRLDQLTAAQYEVRIQCTDKSGTSTQYSTRVCWTQLSSIMHDGSCDNQSLSYELNNSTWSTQQTEGNAVEGLEITLQFPYGLYHVKDSGGLGKASVTVNMQYRKVGATNWTDFTTATITAAKNTAFFRTYRLDNLTAAQYEVRAQCTAKSGTSTRYSTRVFWTQLSSIMYDDFARPGKVLIGIKALATSQLSGGMPAITWLQTREKVWVWNAETSKYEQKPATNPAWAAYDMIHHCRQIKNIHTGNYEFVAQGAPATRAVYQDFVRWAEFCNDRHLTFNYIFDTANDLWTSLQKPEGVGRGKVIMRGTKFGCVCDAPGDPVQLFTVGNILTDKFKETFVSLKDRANAIEVSFPNKDKAYEKEVITVYADDYDESTEPNITQITLDGVTAVEQAYREAKYRLRLNQHLVRTVEHSADIDAIACQINDVVLLAHDVPQWGVSGRLLAATATTLQLDRTVTLDPYKSYALAIQVTNLAAATSQEVQSIVTVGVQGVTKETITDTIALTSELPTVPLKWDLYSFGETNKVVKPFRVLNISRDQDLRRKITCLEYIEEIYTEATDIPEINYSDIDTLLEVSSVSVAEETYRQKDGTMVSDINIAWSIPRTTTAIRGYKVLYSADNGTTWTQWGNRITMLSTSIVGVKTETTYLLKVCTINDLGLVSGGVQASLYVAGKDLPPSDVASVSASVDTTDSTKIQLSWPAVTDIDLRGYRLMEGSTILTLTPIVDTRYTYTATSSREYNFSVVAIDNSGNPSQTPATTSLNITIEPAQVAGFSATILDIDRSRLIFNWIASQDKDIAYYEIRVGDDWSTASLITTHLKATTYTHTLASEGSQNFMIKAINLAGHESLQAAEKRLQITLRPDAPTNLQAPQDNSDRSKLILSWVAPAGHDIVGYIITCGTQSYFTKETTYIYAIPESGTYEFTVKARNVAGYESNAVSISVTVMIEPGDVTGFTISQDMSDHSLLHLRWDNAIYGDLAFFEIREGVSWDAGSLVVTGLAGLEYNVRINQEREYSYWIKAVNRSGKYSQYPAKRVATYDLNPVPVTNIIVTQDTNDRSLINVEWTGISELDFAYYDVRYGWTWEDAIKLTQTKETKYQFRPTEGGNVKIIIKAVSTAGFYSDEASGSLYALMEPQDVKNFIVQQNGEYVELYWDRALENDVVGFEIREGWTFDFGQLIETNITGNSFKYKVDFDGIYHYWIKAINRSNRYSVTAIDYELTVVDLPPKNVIQSFDEIVMQSGAHTNTEFGVSDINWQTIGGRWSDYQTTKFEEVGGRQILRLKRDASGKYPTTGNYLCEQIDVGRVITANIAVKFLSTVKFRGETSAVLQMRTSKDNADWSVWKDFLPAKFVFRYIELRVILTTSNPAKTPEVNRFDIMIDLPDIEKAGTTTVPIGGIRITYNTDFYIIPVVTPYAIGTGVHVEITSRDKTGFNARILNLSNQDVGGTMDWRARGY